MRIEWDEEKRISNLEKHGVDFADAYKLFDGPVVVGEDTRKDYGETRFICYGYIEGRVMAVAFTKRGDAYRVISLRKANNREKGRFETALHDRLE